MAPVDNCWILPFAPHYGAMYQPYSPIALAQKKQESRQWKFGLPWLAELFSKAADNLMVSSFAFLYAGCLRPTLLMLLVMMLSWAFLIQNICEWTKVYFLGLLKRVGGLPSSRHFFDQNPFTTHYRFIENNNIKSISRNTFRGLKSLIHL